MPAIIRRLLLAVAVFVLPCAAAAQAVSSTEIITGLVVGPDSQPIPEARVELTSTVTGTVRRTTTKPDGRFSVLFRDGGGSYRLVVTKIGLSPARTTLQRQGDDDRISITIRMSPNAQQLAAVEVKGRSAQPQGQPQQPAGGAFERTLSSALLERLPTTPGDLAAAAATTPGVVAAPGSDSTASSFTVAAQPASQNNVTVDGARFLFGSLPQDGVRGARVVTNAYDVSRGQFTGGEIATTTKSGTSLFEGSATYRRRDPHLEAGGGALASLFHAGSQHLASGGAGGPLIGDRSYWFASVQGEWRDAPLPSLLGANSQLLNELGTAPDSVGRFLDLLNATARPAANPSLRRRSGNGSALLRLDWDVTDRNALTVRTDWRMTSQTGARMSPLGLPSTGGSVDGRGAGGMASLTTLLADGAFVNELRVSTSRDRQDAVAALDAPSGIVFVAANGRTGTSVVPYFIGGSSSLPSRQERTLDEATDELSWLSRSGAHRVKLGAVVTAERGRIDAIANRFGTYLYNSLGEFASGTPATYVRNFGSSIRDGSSQTAALYLGDVWRASPSLQLVYGARAERSTFRAGSIGRDAQVSPRLGFTYLLGNVTGRPNGAMRGGIGEFRGRVPVELLGAASSTSGPGATQSQLVCVGAGIPRIDWTALEASIDGPTQCADDGGATSPNALPTSIALDPSLAAPRVWRTSFGVQRRVFDRYVLAVDALYAAGVDNVVASDANLVGGANFALGAEGRPVFVPASAIDPTSGAASFSASRTDVNHGSRLSIGSGLRSRTYQVTSQIVGPGFRSGFTNVSYTWQRARDQANGFSLGSFFPTTAGDPRHREWAVSDLQRMHNLQIVSLTPLPHALELSVLGRFASGGAYSPMVSGDVNGDGQRNDRAFVYDASFTDTAVANGMRRLLASTDAATRRCLDRQVGRIAARNSCAAGWTASVDVQVNARPAVWGLDRRLTLSVIATNVGAALDAMLYGDNPRGWGQATFPDRTLLQVRGFDAAAGQFRYTVNERFGTVTGRNNPFRVPFQLAVQARFAFGTDPQRAAIKAQLEGEGGAPLTAEQLKVRLLSNIPYPLRELLRIQDSLALGLTADQTQRLTVLGQAYDTKLDSLVGAAAQIITAAGRNPDPGVIAPKLAPNQQELVRTVERAVTDARAVLTPEQWAKLPESVRLPLQAPPPKRGGSGAH